MTRLSYEERSRYCTDRLGINLETVVGRNKDVQGIGVHGEIQKVVVTSGLAQEYLPLFGRRSIPSCGVARPFHTEEYAQSSRLARRVSQHPNRGRYSCANPPW